MNEEYEKIYKFIDLRKIVKLSFLKILKINKNIVYYVNNPKF